MFWFSLLPNSFPLYSSQTNADVNSSLLNYGFGDPVNKIPETSWDYVFLSEKLSVSGQSKISIKKHKFRHKLP